MKLLKEYGQVIPKAAVYVLACRSLLTALCQPLEEGIVNDIHLVSTSFALKVHVYVCVMEWTEYTGSVKVKNREQMLGLE